MKDKQIKLEVSISVRGDGLMDRVVSILEQARSNVMRAVNSNMVIAYWLIGREIVQELQRGQDRAEYGKQLIKQLAMQLKPKYKRGFSVTNLRYLRTFYSVYSDRVPEICQIGSGELSEEKLQYSQAGVKRA
jgi:predicted GNAT family N-acyltransferase